MFLARCPATVIGITGSNGKSSTATMLAGMFQAAGRTTWLGGNIGNSLLPSLAAIRPADVVVLELSSFQLAHLSPEARFPSAAVVTGCTPNHLDWHGTFSAYAAAKRRLVENLPSGGLAVLNSLANPQANPHDGELSAWPLPAGVRRIDPWPLDRVGRLAVPGDHQRANAALAAAMAEALGVSAGAIGEALAAFRTLPHRQQAVATIAGRHFIDDSKSTTPEATLSALAACAGPTWVLVGGQDKGIALEPLCRQLAQHAAGVACYGALGVKLGAALRAAGARQSTVVERLTEALDWCWEQSRPGDTILLSPAAASLDQFRDFAHRAEVFRAWIAQRAKP
jgi:UDP-N-acetylmuramoylalanine--D-glutamate ligase